MRPRCQRCGTVIAARAYDPARIGMRLRPALINGPALRVGSGAVSAVCLACVIDHTRMRAVQRASVLTVLLLALITAAILHQAALRDGARLLLARALNIVVPAMIAQQLNARPEMPPDDRVNGGQAAPPGAAREPSPQMAGALPGPRMADWRSQDALRAGLCGIALLDPRQAACPR